MSKEKCSDITVIGSGAAGLMTAARLTEKGYQVSVVEKSDKLCNGPSVRNEGWLHPGTYHATSIKDQLKALQVAKRCQYGYAVIRELAPESLEEPDIQSFAIFKDESYAEYAQERWDSAEVFFQSVLLTEFIRNCPEVNTVPIAKAFKVKDLSINTPKLYRNLVRRTLEGGGEFHLQTLVQVDQQQQAWLTSQLTGEKVPLNTQMIINTTGYGMAEFLSQYFGEEYKMRFWKSHLIIYPRLGKHNIFYIEPGEAAAIQHGAVTMIGQHEDATVSPTVDFSPIHEKSSLVRQAAQVLYPSAKLAPYLETACLKPDITQNTNTARSLGVEIYEPQPGFIFALPGKMTESPCVADKLVEMAEERSLKRSAVPGKEKTFIPITPRPCDEWKP